MTTDALSGLIKNIQKTHPDFDPVSLVELAQGIESAEHDRDAPVREIMTRLGDRWSSLILMVLSTGSYRHAALRRIIAVISAEKAISQRMLTLRLRALERDGLVKRHILETVPPSVTYSLTPLGQSLTKRLDAMIVWIKDNEAAILRARMEFEA